MIALPVAALNPYQNSWTVRARVMEKGDKHFTNAKGEGKLFNVTVADATGEIRVTAEAWAGTIASLDAAAGSVPESPGLPGFFRSRRLPGRHAVDNSCLLVQF